jgi:hypothetical protein
MKHFLTIFAACGLLGLSASAFGQDAATLQLDNLDPVTGYLVSPQFIVSRPDLLKVDPDPVPELIAIAKDKKKKDFVRERAIQSLSLFRDARTQTAMTEMLQGKPDKYFSILAMSFLEAFGEDAVPTLKPFLADPDPNVRLTVVKGFGLFGGQAGYDLLVERDKAEDNAQILAQIRSYIQ